MFLETLYILIRVKSLRQFANNKNKSHKQHSKPLSGRLNPDSKSRLLLIIPISAAHNINSIGFYVKTILTEIFTNGLRALNKLLLTRFCQQEALNHRMTAIDSALFSLINCQISGKCISSKTFLETLTRFYKLHFNLILKKIEIVKNGTVSIFFPT